MTPFRKSRLDKGKMYPIPEMQYDMFFLPMFQVLAKLSSEYSFCCYTTPRYYNLNNANIHIAIWTISAQELEFKQPSNLVSPTLIPSIDHPIIKSIDSVLYCKRSLHVVLASATQKLRVLSNL